MILNKNLFHLNIKCNFNNYFELLTKNLKILYNVSLYHFAIKLILLMILLNYSI